MPFSGENVSHLDNHSDRRLARQLNRDEKVRKMNIDFM